MTATPSGPWRPRSLSAAWRQNGRDADARALVTPLAAHSPLPALPVVRSPRCRSLRPSSRPRRPSASKFFKQICLRRWSLPDCAPSRQIERTLLGPGRSATCFRPWSQPLQLGARHPSEMTGFPFERKRWCRLKTRRCERACPKTLAPERNSSRSHCARDGHRFESPPLHHEVRANWSDFLRDRIARHSCGLRPRQSVC